MWMPFADGYGSISSWYQWRSFPPPPGSGFGVWKARSSFQTRCHFVSICSGSYLVVTSISNYKKASRKRGRGKLAGLSPPVLPVLVEELLPLHLSRIVATQYGKPHVCIHGQEPQGSRQPGSSLRGRSERAR